MFIVSRFHIPRGSVTRLLQYVNRFRAEHRELGEFLLQVNTWTLQRAIYNTELSLDPYVLIM